MCGIYGFISKTENSEKVLDTFIDLGIRTESRGTHATGYYGVNSEVYMQKAPIKASEFYIETKEFYEFYSHIPGILIGHNRHATVGHPRFNKNNHPFMNDRYGFIHNGCCKGWVKFESLDIKTESDCDSEWIFRYLLKTIELHHGNIFSAIKKTLNVFDDSSVACAMVDSKTRKLWLFRNIGNPICYMINKELKTFFFASTPFILKESLAKQALPHSNIIEMEKGEILCIDEDLNITKEISCGLRESRTSYMTNWFTPKKKVSISTVKKPVSITSSLGLQCLKCGKKFIHGSPKDPTFWIKKHLIEEHDILKHLDEDEFITDYFVDLNPDCHVAKPIINRKREFSKTYSSFTEMQKETDEILKTLEII